MSPQQDPEIKRVPLENLFLQVKAMRENEDVKAFLGKALDPPETGAIEAAFHILVESGALEPAKGYTAPLTPLGRHLVSSRLDTDPADRTLTLHSSPTCRWIFGSAKSSSWEEC